MGLRYKYDARDPAFEALSEEDRQQYVRARDEDSWLLEWDDDGGVHHIGPPEKMKWWIGQSEYDKLSPLVQQCYTSHDSGRFSLNIDGDDGELETPPEDSHPLRSAHERQKAEARDLRARIAAVGADKEAGNDAQTVALLEKRLSDVEARNAQIPIDGQAALDAQATHYEPLIKEAHEQLEATLAEGDRLFFEYETTRAIQAAGGVPELLMPRVEKFCRTVRDEAGERRLAIFTTDGNERIGADGRPVGIAQALAELRAFDAVLATHAFLDSGSRNGGAPK